MVAIDKSGVSRENKVVWRHETAPKGSPIVLLSIPLFSSHCSHPIPIVSLLNGNLLFEWEPFRNLLLYPSMGTFYLNGNLLFEWEPFI